MAWYNTTGCEQDVVVSSRVRLARNLADYPFEPKLNPQAATEIIDKVHDIFNDSGYEYTDFSNLMQTQAVAYAERHIVSNEFAQKKSPHALLENESNQIDIMVCEEDHLRIQCIMSGLAIDEAYRRASEADDSLDDKLNIAYSESLGYLTHCPTNLGTGMRASVMLFLPALTMKRQINDLQSQLVKIGLTIRGMFGEGSSTDGCLYQISNQVTLGMTEEETINKLSNIISQVIEMERNLRASLFKGDDAILRMSDKCKRSLGTLLNAELISSTEFMKLYADVRLGVSQNVISNTDYTKLDGLLVKILPANIIELYGENTASNELLRDHARAQYVRQEIIA